jgi:uncharacterized protein
MQSYKSSKYNIFYQYNNNYYIFNTFTLGLSIVDNDTFILLKDSKSDQDSLNKLITKRPDEFSELVTGGLIVNKKIAEEKMVWLRYNKIRFSSNILSPTIVPTNDCNLCCDYCYQIGRSDRMSREIEQLSINFIIKHLKKKDILSVSWYGGEPLLALDTIKRVSSHLIRYCKTEKIKYMARVITNGTLLNKKNLYELKESGVNQVQITIDGLKETHDNRRPFKRGEKSSFEVIFSNIDTILGEITINIRINVDKSNMNEVPQLLELIKRKGYLAEGKNVYVCLGFIRPWTDKISSIKSQCFNMSDFSQARINFIKERYESKAHEILFPSLENLCTAVSEYSFVIDPSGNLKKCWIEVNSEKSNLSNIGTVIDYYDFNNPRTIQWLTYDPLMDNNPCGDCVYFPLCLGGCPYLQIFKKDSAFEECDSWRNEIDNILKIIIDENQAKSIISFK